MARRIKKYDSLPQNWQKQIIHNLKRNEMSLIDVNVQESKKKAVLVNAEEEEWLVIIDMEMSGFEEADDEDYYYDEDYDSDNEDIDIENED